jgi:hypothetical protein
MEDMAGMGRAEQMERHINAQTTDEGGEATRDGACRMHLDDGIEVCELSQVIPLDRSWVGGRGVGEQAVLCQLSCHLGFHVGVLRQQVQCPGHGVRRCINPCEPAATMSLQYMHVGTHQAHVYVKEPSKGSMSSLSDTTKSFLLRTPACVCEGNTLCLCMSSKPPFSRKLALCQANLAGFTTMISSVCTLLPSIIGARDGRCGLR